MLHLARAKKLKNLKKGTESMTFHQTFFILEQIDQHPVVKLLSIL